jgi:NAD(P)-dependent dehydrogenase (short-subunit alcohol dehydrogenase family)
VADVNSKEGIAALSEAFSAAFSAREKHLCVLVNNAGVTSTKIPCRAETAAELKSHQFESDEANFDDWTDAYRTNVASVHLVTMAFLPLLQASTEAHYGWSSTVINITSIAGLVKSSQTQFSYNASKGAAVHLTRMTANDLAASGLKIRVNGIAPGLFPSEMTDRGSGGDPGEGGRRSELAKETMEGVCPAARPGKAEDMASAVLFFVANQYLNGQTVAVDGGWTLFEGM